MGDESPGCLDHCACRRYRALRHPCHKVLHPRELLEVEPLHIEKTVGIDIEDAERLVHHLAWLAVHHVDDQIRLANALAGALRTAVPEVRVVALPPRRRATLGAGWPVERLDRQGHGRRA